MDGRAVAGIVTMGLFAAGGFSVFSLMNDRPPRTIDEISADLEPRTSVKVDGHAVTTTRTPAPSTITTTAPSTTTTTAPSTITTTTEPGSLQFSSGVPHYGVDGR
jgi:hypothetical protein